MPWQIIPLLAYELEDAATCVAVLPLAQSSLAEAIPSGSLASEASRYALSRDILAALDYLHALGIAHGDIKPSNILRLHHGWVLADFGCALDASRQHITWFAEEDETRQVCGTVSVHHCLQAERDGPFSAYFPPERLLGHSQHPTTAGDIWAWTCTLAEATLRRYPFVHIQADPYGSVWDAPGELEQLIAIYRVLGTPTDATDEMGLLFEARPPLSPAQLFADTCSATWLPLFADGWRLAPQERATASILLARISNG